MARNMWQLAKWHIWLGWLIGVPLLLWTVSGLVMVARPIDEVRGEHLRKPIVERPLPRDARIAIDLNRLAKPVRSVAIGMEGGLAITRVTFTDDSVARFSEGGRRIPALNEVAARLVVQRAIKGGEQVVRATLFPATAPPLEFRRPLAAWQVVLENGTHVYVGEQTGDILAIRTPYWRVFDVAWGLHIMDLEMREDTSHPVLIGFAALSALGVLIGILLLFRRRLARQLARAG